MTPHVPPGHGDHPVKLCLIFKVLICVFLWNKDCRVVPEYFVRLLYEKKSLVCCSTFLFNLVFLFLLELQLDLLTTLYESMIMSLDFYHKLVWKHQRLVCLPPPDHRLFSLC